MSWTCTIGCVSITTWILRWILCAFLSICLFLFCIKTFRDGSRFKEFMCNFFIIILSCKVKIFSHHHHRQFINIFSQSWVLNFVCVCVCVPCFSFLLVPTNTMGFGFKLNIKWGFPIQSHSLTKSPPRLSSSYDEFLLAQNM